MIMKCSCQVFIRVAGILLFVATVVSTPYGFKRGSGITFGKNMRLTSKVALSNDELYLYRLIMNYRQQNGLTSIPVSPSLSYVARLHARDLEMHPPSGSCSMHSWSEHGTWKPFRYNGSESAEYMWRKPAELTSYRGRGYEIVAWTSDRMEPNTALSLWMDSSQHNPVIINTGNWERLRWNAVGVAISGNYAVVWFGEEPDYAGKTVAGAQKKTGKMAF
jgi:hypothetical protein